MKRTLFSLLFLVYTSLLFSQGNFQFFGKKTKKQELSFKLINNLIIVPMAINGRELSFILDSGVNKTILFNLTKNDSIGLKNVRKVYVYGLGDGEPVEALLSRKNTFRINNIVNTNESLYVILKDAFNISARMGTTIHGIIGYDLLKDVIAKIDYRNKKIVFYNPKTYKEPKKCRKCDVFPLEFYRNKPYINVQGKVDTIGTAKIDLKLLVDLGGSDAMWLFEDSKKQLKTPKKHFKDILGEGFSGTIYGNRSKIPELLLGKFTITRPTVSFLDSVSTLNARKFKNRNGSIGGGILKRFKVWIDYPNKKIILKKKESLKKGFYYNMSGLQVIYNGEELIKEEAITKYTDSYGNKTNETNSISFITNYSYRFKPSFKIDNVVLNSPGGKAGLQKGDIIKSINGKPAYNFTLGDIISLFQTKPNKKIKIKVERGITKLKFEFRLEKRI